MKRYLYSILILVIFIGFAIFINTKNATNRILEIITPTMFEIDLNSNGKIDDDETVCIPDLESFTTDLDQNLITEEKIKLGYLAEEYSRNLLYLKPVKVVFNNKKNQNCKFGEIYVDGVKYSQKLFDQGLGAINNKFQQDAFEKQQALANKLNLKILNLKSNKYHKLDCEYGIQSSDYIIISKRQLSKDAKPCKYCHIEKNENSIKHLIPPKKVENSNVKLIVTDFTKILSPNHNCTSEICTNLLTQINNAQKSIDMAVYGWDDITEIKQALIKAKNRGVKIRVVYDTTSNNKYYYKDTLRLTQIADESKSDNNIYSKVLTDQLMHNKFIIFDNKSVFTGSMNFSYTGLSGFNANSVLIIESQDVAELYTAEFEQMLEGKFHSEKTKLKKNNHFKLNDTKLSVYFSPYDKGIQKIIPIINSAQNYIYMPAFLITHKDLSESLIKAKERGVDIKIIIDANSTNTKNTKHELLRNHGILLKTENFAGKMHSKSIIIDDKYLVIGSMNFSNSGENKNDENSIILENSAMTKYYKEFFLYLWNQIPNKWLTQNAIPESKDSIGSCYDGIDNDFDGLIDKAESTCH